MTSAQTNALIFKDQAGEYYLLPQATLERGRVPAQQSAELERLVAETAQGGVAGDDVQGHIFLIGVAIGYFGTKAIIEGSRDEGVSP